MDQQLRWVLQQEVFYPVAFVRIQLHYDRGDIIRFTYYLPVYSSIPKPGADPDELLNRIYLHGDDADDVHPLLCTLTNFIRFHMKLVLENYTTIENLEREEGAKSKFDIGRRRNWEQVFGATPSVWWLPMHTQASRPIGDGVRWRVHYTRVIDEDEEAQNE